MGERSALRVWFEGSLPGWGVIATTVGLFSFARLDAIPAIVTLPLQLLAAAFVLGFIIDHACLHTTLVLVRHEVRTTGDEEWLSSVGLGAGVVIVGVVFVSVDTVRSSDPVIRLWASPLLNWAAVVLFDCGLIGLGNGVVRLCYHETAGGEAERCERASQEANRLAQSRQEQAARLEAQRKAERERWEQSAEPCPDPDCRECAPLRARRRGQDALVETELHFARHAAVLSTVFPAALFRCRLTAIAARPCGWDGVVRECRRLRDHVSRLVEAREVWGAYQLNERSIADPAFAVWLGRFVAAYMGDDHPVEAVSKRAEEAKVLIVERARKARKVVREAAEETTDRAVARARAALVVRGEEADRAAAVQRIPLFDEMTPPEKDRAVRDMVALIRRERGDRNTTSAGGT